MSNFRSIDRQTGFLLPPSVDEWLPGKHLARFVVEVIRKCRASRYQLGLFAVTAMLAFYALEHRSHWYVLAFVSADALASAYGFLQGAWPFGVIEGIWMLVAFRRWWRL